jgi:hypothetical protein
MPAATGAVREAPDARGATEAMEATGEPLGRALLQIVEVIVGVKVVLMVMLVFIGLRVLLLRDFEFRVARATDTFISNLRASLLPGAKTPLVPRTARSPPLASAGRAGRGRRR